MNRSQLLQRARQIEDRLVAWRREFHRHPEPGFAEVWTAQFIADQLSQLGVAHQTGVARTGLIAELGEGDRRVALRADMDALPIQEENEVAYASQIPGWMHACGHDVHMACLLGAAQLLAEEAAAGRLPGRVRLLFQPAEESADDRGRSGAVRMLEQGAMEGVDAILGLHVAANLAVGSIAVRDGATSAFTDGFRLEVAGTAAHGAYPQKGFDAIVLSAHVIQALQTVVSRRVDPTKGRVLTIGTINGGDKENIVAGKVSMSGTIRTFDHETRTTVFAEMRRACGVARALGGDFDLTIEEGYDAVINDPDICGLVRQTAAELLGADKVLELPVQMHGDDFGYLSQRAPGCYFDLGGARPDDAERFHHNPRFDVDESCLPIGAGLLAEATLAYLTR